MRRPAAPAPAASSPTAPAAAAPAQAAASKAPAPAADGAARARQEAELEALRAQVRAEAWAAGAREGREAAFAEWTARLGAAVTSLESAARALRGARLELAAEVERHLPSLLGVLARKILGRELSVGDTAARTVVRAIAERLAGGAHAAAVRVAPAVLETLEAWRREGVPEAAELAGVRLEADPSLHVGDFVVDLGDGFLDGRVESQLEAVWDVITEAHS